MKHNIRCERADPTSKCRCRCKGRLHGITQNSRQTPLFKAIILREPKDVEVLHDALLEALGE